MVYLHRLSVQTCLFLGIILLGILFYRPYVEFLDVLFTMVVLNIWLSVDCVKLEINLGALY